MYGVSKGTSPKIFKDLSKPSVQNCKLELQPEVSILQVNTVYDAAKIIYFLGPKIEKLVPREINKTVLSCFKKCH